MRRAATFGLTVLGVFCFGFQGWASEFPPVDDHPILLSPWVIEERVDRRLQPAREDSFASTLGPSAVVTSAEWAARNVGTLAEALRRVPGVMLQESFGGFEPPRLSIRGSGLDSAPTARGVAMLLDGLPLARADGSFHAGLFDPQLFSRVEIYRGTMHMAITPAVLGGVLNAVSQPMAGAGDTTLRFEAGDFSVARAQVSHLGSRFRVGGVYARSEGWREHSEQQRRAIETAVQYSPGATTRVEFSIYAAAARYDVPGPLILRDALARPRSISLAVQRDLPRRDSNLFRITSRLKSTRGDATIAAGLSLQRLHDDFVQLQSNGETDATSDDGSVHGTVSKRVRLAGLEHHVLARATFTMGVNRSDRYVNNRGQRGARFAAFDAAADTTALSIEDILWLNPGLALGAGATAVHAGRELRDRGMSGALARSFSLADLSPRLGATWVASSHATFHAALSRGIEPPSFDDLVSVSGVHPNLTLRSQELRAQRAATFEVGGRGRIGRIGWNVTAYRGRWRDEILRLADASGQPRGAINAGPTRHEGIETALSWAITGGTHRLSLNVTSTLGRFRFVDDPVYGEKRIAGAPPHVGTAELAYEHQRGFIAALEPTWVAGRTFVDHAGRLSYGGHALMHVRIGWRRDARFAVFMACRNVFDRAHLASTAGVLDLARSPATTTIFLPGAGRGFSMGITWKPGGSR